MYHGAYPYQQYYHPYANGPFPHRAWEQPHWQQYGATYSQPWDNGQGPVHLPPPAPHPPYQPIPGYDYAQYMPAYNVPSSSAHPAVVTPAQHPACMKCGRPKPPKETSADNKESQGKRSKKRGQHDSSAKNSDQQSNFYPAPQYVNGQWIRRPAYPGPSQNAERGGPPGTAPHKSQHGADGHSIVFNVNSQPYPAHNHYPHVADSGPYVIANGQRVYSGCDHCQPSSGDKKGGSKNKKNNKDNKNSSKKKGKKGNKSGADDPWGQQDDDDDDNQAENTGNDDDNDSSKNEGSQKSEKSTNSKENNGGGTDDNNPTSGGATWDSGDAWNNNQNNQGEKQANWNSGDAWGGSQNNQGQQNGGDPFARVANGQNSLQPANSDGAQNALQQPHWQQPQPQHQHQHQRAASPMRRQLQTTYAPANGIPQFVSPEHQQPITDEPPLYTVPASFAKQNSLTHQVQVGGSSNYSHKISVPQYLDSMEEPYAKFVFQYRRKGRSSTSGHNGQIWPTADP